MLPNFSDAYFRVTVASASDDQLAEHLISSLGTIDDIAHDNGRDLFEPTEEGLAPQSFHEKMRKPGVRGQRLADSGAYRIQYSNLVAAERRVRAIRAEQARREAAAKAEAKQKVADERARHEAVLAEGPQELARLVALAEQHGDALQTIAALAEAIETVAGQVNLSRQIAASMSHIEQAAKALGVEPPELQDVPDVPLDAAQRLHDALLKLGMQQGRQGIG